MVPLERVWKLCALPPTPGPVLLSIQPLLSFILHDEVVVASKGLSQALQAILADCETQGEARWEPLISG